MFATSVAPPAARSRSGAGVPATVRAHGRGRTRRQRRSRNPALTFAVLGSATMSFTTVRAGEVLLSDLMFLVSAVLIVMKMLAGNEKGLAARADRRGSTLLLVGALVLLTSGTLSSLGSWNPAASMTVVLRFAWITVIWFWILRAVCADRDALNRLLRAWRLSSLLTAVAAILGNIGIAFVSEQAGNRQVGLSGHPNHLAGQLAATFTLFLLAVPRDGTHMARRERTSWLVTLGLCSTAMFASGSITGLLAITAAAATVGVVFLVSRSPDRPRRHRSPLAPMLLMVVLMLGVAALLTSDLPVVDRITRYNDGDAYVTSSVDYRGDTNSMVINRFDDFLVVGLGYSHNAGTAGIADGADPDDPSIRNFGVHNMVLGLLYQAGLPSVIGLVLIIFATLRQLTTLLRRTDANLYLTTLALVGAIVAVNVNAMFQPTAFDRFYWMPVAMVGCVWSVRRKELREAARVSG